MVAEPDVEEILVELGDGLEVAFIVVVAIAEVVEVTEFVVVDPPGVVDTPGLEGALEDSDGVGVLDGTAGIVEENKEVEGEEEDDEDEEGEVAGHSSLSVPVRGPGPMQ